MTTFGKYRASFEKDGKRYRGMRRRVRDVPAIKYTGAGVLLRLDDGRVLRQCLPCAAGEHEDHVDDGGCDGCAICLSVRPQPTPSGS